MLSESVLKELEEFTRLHSSGMPYEDIYVHMGVTEAIARSYRMVLMRSGNIQRQIPPQCKRAPDPDKEIRKERYAEHHRRGYLTHHEIVTELGLNERTAARYRRELIMEGRITPRSPSTRSHRT